MQRNIEESEETVTIHGKLPGSVVYGWYNRQANLRVSQYTNLLSGLRPRTAYGSNSVECRINRNGSEVTIDITEALMFHDDFFVLCRDMNENHPLVVAHRLKLKELKAKNRKIFFSHREVINDGVVELKKLDDKDENRPFRVVTMKSRKGDENEVVAAIEMEEVATNFTDSPHGRRQKLTMSDRMATSFRASMDQEVSTTVELAPPTVKNNEASDHQLVTSEHVRSVFDAEKKETRKGDQPVVPNKTDPEQVKRQTIFGLDDSLAKNTIGGGSGDRKTTLDQFAIAVSAKMESKEHITASAEQKQESLPLSALRDLPGGVEAALHDADLPWNAIKISNTQETPSLNARFLARHPPPPTSLARAVSLTTNMRSQFTTEQALEVLPEAMSYDIQALGKRDFEYMEALNSSKNIAALTEISEAHHGVKERDLDVTATETNNNNLHDQISTIHLFKKSKTNDGEAISIILETDIRDKYITLDVGKRDKQEVLNKDEDYIKCISWNYSSRIESLV